MELFLTTDEVVKWKSDSPASNTHLLWKLQGALVNKKSYKLDYQSSYNMLAVKLLRLQLSQKHFICFSSISAWKSPKPFSSWLIPLHISRNINPSIRLKHQDDCVSNFYEDCMSSLSIFFSIDILLYIVIVIVLTKWIIATKKSSNQC